MHHTAFVCVCDEPRVCLLGPLEAKDPDILPQEVAEAENGAKRE